LIIILIIVAVIGGVVWAGGGTSTTSTNGVTVQFNGVDQTWNDTTPIVLDWGQPAPLMSYYKNMTVTNSGNTTITPIIITTEPVGAHLTWLKNNTAVPAGQSTSADLTLTTDATLAAGSYTWRFIPSNILATPTPTPTPTPISETRYNCTIKTSGVGIATIKVTDTTKGGSIILTPSTLPYNVTFTSGDALKFETTTITGYTFNAYTFSDGTFPQSNPTFNCIATAEFTITANCLLTATP
jgi:hypothetical protein